MGKIWKTTRRSQLAPNAALALANYLASGLVMPGDTMYALILARVAEQRWMSEPIRKPKG